MTGWVASQTYSLLVSPSPRAVRAISRASLLVLYSTNTRLSVLSSWKYHHHYHHHYHNHLYHHHYHHHHQAESGGLLENLEILIMYVLSRIKSQYFFSWLAPTLLSKILKWKIKFKAIMLNINWILIWFKISIYNIYCLSTNPKKMKLREAFIKKKKKSVTFFTLGSDPPLFSGKCKSKKKK